MTSDRNSIDDLRVRPGTAAKLRKRPTEPADKVDKAGAKELLAAQTEELAALQERLYARGTYAVLAVFQAMDAAGKDSTIEHVFAGVNPQGCQVASFKTPSADELGHDFLWRVSHRLPARGHLGVFNRSHYEETLVVRVHPEYLGPQKLPPTQDPDDLWAERYEDINAFERHLDRSGTKVVKFFLHVSKDEQRRRFLSRIDEPEKRWKFNPGDVDERERWDDYAAAYEETLSATSTEWAPWYVVPADHKPTMRLLVSRVLLETMRALDLDLPEPTEAELALLEQSKARLQADD
jgi:PPK2 family polyphosphate:nucleotide phosphotransferase